MAETEVTTVQDYRLSETEAMVQRQIERVEKMLEEQMAKTAALVEKQLERARSFLQQNHEKLKEKNRDSKEQAKLQTPTNVITEVYTNTLKSTQTSSHGHTATEDVPGPCSIKLEPLKRETVSPYPYPLNTSTGLISPLQTGEMCQLTSKSEKVTSDSASLEWVCRQCNATNKLQLKDIHENSKHDCSEKNLSEIDNQRQSTPKNVISRSQKSLDNDILLLANKQPTSSLVDHTNQQKHQSVRKEDILSECNEIFSPQDIDQYSFKEDIVENPTDQANCSSILQSNVTDKNIKSQERDTIAQPDNSQPCNLSLLTDQNDTSGIHRTKLESRENIYSEQESQIASLEDMKDFISKSTQTILSFEIIMSEDTNLRNQVDPISKNTMKSLIKQKGRKNTPLSTSDEDTSKSSITYDLHSTDTLGTNTSSDPTRNKINLMSEPNHAKSISDDDSLQNTYALRLEDSNDDVETKTNNSSQTTVIFNRTLSDSNGSISIDESMVVSLDVSVESIIANDCITRELSVSLSHDETCSNVAMVEADEKKENCVIGFVRNQQQPDTAKCIKDYEDVNTLSHQTSTESVSTSTHVNQKSLETVMNQTDDGLRNQTEPLHRSETLDAVNDRIAENTNNTLPHDSKESSIDIQQLAKYQQLDNKLTLLNEESSSKTSVSGRHISPYDTIDKVVFRDGSLVKSPIHVLERTETLLTSNEGIPYPTEAAETLREVFLGYVDPSGIARAEQIHNQNFEVGIIAESAQRMYDESNSELSYLEDSVKDRSVGVVEEVFAAAAGERCGDKSTINDQSHQITNTEEHVDGEIFKRETKSKTTQLLFDDSHPNGNTVSIQYRLRDINDDLNDKKPAKSSYSDQSDNPTTNDKQTIDEIFETEIIPEVAPLPYDDNIPRGIKTHNFVEDKSDCVQDQNQTRQRKDDETIDPLEIHDNTDQEYFAPETAALLQAVPRDDLNYSTNSVRDEEDIIKTTDNQAGNGKEIGECSDSVGNVSSNLSTLEEHTNHVVFESEIIPETVPLLYMDDKNNPNLVRAKSLVKDISEIDNIDKKRSQCTVEEDIFAPESAPLLYSDSTCSNKPVQGDEYIRISAAIQSHPLTSADNNQDSSEYSGSSPTPQSNASDVMYELLENNSDNDRNNSQKAEKRKLASFDKEFESYALLKDSDYEHSESMRNICRPEKSTDHLASKSEDNIKHLYADTVNQGPTVRVVTAGSLTDHQPFPRIVDYSDYANKSSSNSLSDIETHSRETSMGLGTGVLSDNDSNQNQKHRNDIHITNLETKIVAEFTKTKTNVDPLLPRPPCDESTKITDKVKIRSTIDNKLGTTTSEKDKGNLVFQLNLSNTRRNTDLDNNYQHSLHSKKSDESGPRTLNIELPESQSRPLSIELGQGPVKEEDTHGLLDESSTEEELDSSFFERERERYVHTTSSASSSFVFEETDVSSYQRTSGSDDTESKSPNLCETKPETTERMPFEHNSDREVYSFCESDISIGREDLSSSILQFSSINQDTVDGSTEDIIIDETFSRITRIGETNPSNSSKKHSIVKSHDKSKGGISSRKTKSSIYDNAKRECVRKVRTRNWKSDPGVSSTDTDPAVQLSVTVRSTKVIAGNALISQSNTGPQLGLHLANSPCKREEFDSSRFDSSNLSIRSEAHDSIDGSEDWTTTDDIESNILHGTAEDSTDVEDTFLKEELTFVDSSETTDVMATSSETITQIANPGYKRS